MHVVTGDPKYQDWGWEIFQAVLRHCKTPSGFSGIRDVTVEDPSAVEWNDSTQSFWMGETLKYFYLLFQPPVGMAKTGHTESVIDLDRMVLFSHLLCSSEPFVSLSTTHHAEPR